MLMEDTALAVRLSLLSAGVWWLVFTYIFPQRMLRQRRPQRELPAGAGFVGSSLRQLRRTLLEMHRKYPMTLRYLIAYLIYNDGIQTVIVVATSFAFQELGVGNETLLLLVLMIQFIAFGGAFFFGWLATRIGTKPAIMSSLVVWSGLVIYAYLFLYTETQLFVIGVVLALVLGGSQALSRSLSSQMIPPAQEAEFFGFYEISERGTSWVGPLAFGAAVMITGSQRIAIVTLIFFFVAGLLLLSRVDVARAIAEAGQGSDQAAVEKVVHGYS
jgi:MFS transporter, UMF1 family